MSYLVAHKNGIAKTQLAVWRISPLLQIKHRVPCGIQLFPDVKREGSLPAPKRNWRKNMPSLTKPIKS